MRKQAFCLVLVLAVMMAAATFVVAQGSRKSVSAAEVNGTYKMNFLGKFKKFSNEVKILALGGGKIRFAMDLLYPYSMKNGEPTVNMGGFDDEATIVGDIANYESEDGNCKFVFKFVRPGTLKITEDQTEAGCGFGRNVMASGTYRKVSGKKPTFDQEQ